MYLKSVLHHLASMGMFVQCRILGGMFSHLQSLDRDFLHLQRLVGISKIFMSGYSAMHLRCLSYVASENWCCCSFIIKVNIGVTSMRVQVLMWSVVKASWQRWMLAWLQCKYCFTAKMDVGMASVQILLHSKDECWHNYSGNIDATSM